MAEASSCCGSISLAPRGQSQSLYGRQRGLGSNARTASPSRSLRPDQAALSLLRSPKNDRGAVERKEPLVRVFAAVTDKAQRMGQGGSGKGQLLSHPPPSGDLPAPLPSIADELIPHRSAPAENLGYEKAEAEEASEKATAGNGEASSSIDRIEVQAKASLSRLKSLLYKLKTRPERGVRTSFHATPSFSDASDGSRASVVEDERQVFVSQKIEVDLSPSEDVTKPEAEQSSNAKESSKAMERGSPQIDSPLEVQLDALTGTRATVKFDDATKTATVTVTSTVRAAELADEAHYSKKAIAMAAKALARTCLELDEKAQVAASAAASAATTFTMPPPPPFTPPLSAPSTARAASTLPHHRALRSLLIGTVASWRLAGPEFGTTPFRPVFAVRLQLPDGRKQEAIFKPFAAGDRLLRWKRAPEDWVAYQISSLLGLDIVPPAVIRTGLILGNHQFEAGVMILKPAPLVHLEDVHPSAVKRQPSALVSDVRILDSLLGNALRHKSAFHATTSHWADDDSAPSQQDGGSSSKQFHPVLLGHPTGPGLGESLHCMWTTTSKKARPGSVQVVSSSTLARLKGLTRGVLLEAMGGALSAEEMDVVLAKRDHILAYLEALCRRDGLASVCV